MTIWSPPKVSIGLPVYNGEKYVARALESLLAQTFIDFELIVSDNASTDSTSEIVKVFLTRDRRIRYFRQEENLGAINNFGFVLEKATAAYFMWAASDDHWAPEFVEKNLRFLEANADYVTSVSQAVFDDADADPGDVMGTSALSGSVRDNLQTYILRPAANTRFYGLHRTQIIRKAWVSPSPYWAADWAIVCRTLEFGKHQEVPLVLMMRSYRGASSSAYDAINRLEVAQIYKLLPFLLFTTAVLKIRSVRSNPRLLLHFIWLNLDGMIMMLRKRFGLGR